MLKAKEGLMKANESSYSSFRSVGSPAGLPHSRKKLDGDQGAITYAEGVIAGSPGLQCEASYPGFKSSCSSTLKALLPKRSRSAITPSGYRVVGE